MYTNYINVLLSINNEIYYLCYIVNSYSYTASFQPIKIRGLL